jgi:hypothetical protein
LLPPLLFPSTNSIDTKQRGHRRKKREEWYQVKKNVLRNFFQVFIRNSRAATGTMVHNEGVWLGTGTTHAFPNPARSHWKRAGSALLTELF